MGLEGISIWQLLIILLVVVLLFGTKKLRDLGSDLGVALKSFRGALRENQGPERTSKDPEGLQPSEGVATNADVRTQPREQD